MNLCPAWPWKLMDDLAKNQGTSFVLLQAVCIISQPSVNSNWSCSPETPNSAQNRWFLSLGIWQMIWKSKRTPLLTYFKICASFRSHWRVKTGVTVQKHTNIKIGKFCPLWPWNLTDDLEINTAPILCHFNLCASFHSNCKTRLQKYLEILKLFMDQYSSIRLGYFLLWTEIIAQAVVWEELLSPPNRMALVVTILSVTNAV